MKFYVNTKMTDDWSVCQIGNCVTITRKEGTVAQEERRRGQNDSSTGGEEERRRGQNGRRTEWKEDRMTGGQIDRRTE